MARKLNLEAGVVQVSTLLYALGKEAEKVNLLCTESERHPRKGLVLTSERKSTSNRWRNIFTPSMSLPILANLVRDRLVIGIMDKELSEKLLISVK